MKSLALVSLLMAVTGCASQALESSRNVRDNAVIRTESEPMKNDQPLQIATWSPTKYDGRFTAMGSGYLTKFNNCLTMTMGSKEDITKNNTYLLVLADNAFSWDAAKEILLFEGKQYKIGDEIYLGGTVFTYPNANITDQIKVNWIECGLDRGWLGG